MKRQKVFLQILFLAGLFLVNSNSAAVAQCNTALAMYRMDEGTGPSIKDWSGNNNKGLIAGAKHSTQNPFNMPGNYSLLFDDPRDAVTIQAGPATNLNSMRAMTLEAQIYPLSIEGIHYIIWADDDMYSLAIRDGQLRLAINHALAVSAPFTSIKKWSHVAATYDGSKARLYVNGVEVATNAFSVPQVGPVSSFRNIIRIGNDETADLIGFDRDFGGLIDDVCIVDRALTSKEVKYDATHSYTPDESVDCNGNGVHDACDLASGTSADANGNEVPDECEEVVTPPASDTCLISVRDLGLFDPATGEAVPGSGECGDYISTRFESSNPNKRLASIVIEIPTGNDAYFDSWGTLCGWAPDVTITGWQLDPNSLTVNFLDVDPATDAVIQIDLDRDPATGGTPLSTDFFGSTITARITDITNPQYVEQITTSYDVVLGAFRVRADSCEPLSSLATPIGASELALELKGTLEEANAQDRISPVAAATLEGRYALIGALLGDAEPEEGSGHYLSRLESAREELDRANDDAIRLYQDDQIEAQLYGELRGTALELRGQIGDATLQAFPHSGLGDKICLTGRRVLLQSTEGPDCDVLVIRYTSSNPSVRLESIHMDLTQVPAKFDSWGNACNDPQPTEAVSHTFSNFFQEMDVQFMNSTPGTSIPLRITFEPDSGPGEVSADMLEGAVITATFSNVGLITPNTLDVTLDRVQTHTNIKGHSCWEPPVLRLAEPTCIWSERGLLGECGSYIKIGYSDDNPDRRLVSATIDLSTAATPTVSFQGFGNLCGSTHSGEAPWVTGYSFDNADADTEPEILNLYFARFSPGEIELGVTMDLNQIILGTPLVEDLDGATITARFLNGEEITAVYNIFEAPGSVPEQQRDIFKIRAESCGPVGPFVINQTLRGQLASIVDMTENADDSQAHPRAAGEVAELALRALESMETIEFYQVVGPVLAGFIAIEEAMNEIQERVSFFTGRGLMEQDFADVVVGLSEAPREEAETQKQAMTAATSPVPESPNFFRGDTNGDGGKNIADGQFIINFLFLGTVPALPCEKASDVNDDGSVNLADPSYLLNFTFLGTEAPAAPFNACGQDPTVDSLDCQSFDACQ